MGFESVAEEKIREALEAGLFSNLRGEGKPLRNLDDDMAGDDWVGLHVLRENGFLPEWLELRKQVFHDRDTVTMALERWHDAARTWGSASHPIVIREEESYRRCIKEINAKIDLHNIRCPSFQFEIARYREDDGRNPPTQPADTFAGPVP